jgi:hypothetical protein
MGYESQVYRFECLPMLKLGNRQLDGSMESGQDSIRQRTRLVTAAGIAKLSVA